MIKALEWLLAGALGFAIWLAGVLNVRAMHLSSTGTNLLLYFPVYAVFLFALTSLAIILYRVTTFHDCPEAARELKEQMEEARRDLTKKGFKF